MTVHVELSSDAALVLFEFLARNEGNLAAPRTEHRAEQHALELVFAQLEKELVEPFKPEYAELVEKARLALVEKWGE